MAMAGRSLDPKEIKTQTGEFWCKQSSSFVKPLTRLGKH
jgi:hypothetical protein